MPNSSIFSKSLSLVTKVIEFSITKAAINNSAKGKSRPFLSYLSLSSDNNEDVLLVVWRVTKLFKKAKASFLLLIFLFLTPNLNSNSLTKVILAGDGYLIDKSLNLRIVDGNLLSRSIKTEVSITNVIS